MTGPPPRRPTPSTTDDDTSSTAHRLAVLQQDNGELAEDVIHQNIEEQLADRIIDSRPAPQVARREHPADPVPGTLPGEDDRFHPAVD